MKEEKCPKCASPMVEVGMVDEEESGRLTWELEQGLTRLLECPKCKYYFWQEGHFGHILNRDGLGKHLDDPLTQKFFPPEEIERWKKYRLEKIPNDLWMDTKGRLIEAVVENRYKEFYNVAKLTSFFDGKLCLQEKLIKGCLSFDHAKAIKVLSDIRSASEKGCWGLPDFLFVNKSNKESIFFVECKGLGSVLLPNQRIVFERLENLGYAVKLLELDVRLRLDGDDFDQFVSLINWRDKLEFK